MEDAVNAGHLIDDHGLDKSLVRRWSPAALDHNTRRILSLQLEMRHSADHAQRKVGHEHD